MPRRLIVTCGFGDRHESLGRMAAKACHRHGAGASIYYWSELPFTWPTQAAEPYAFKIHAIRQAIAEANPDTVLWMDATYCPITSLEPLWQHIESVGWYASPQGSSKLSTWCSDAALEIFAISRSMAGHIHMVLSGLVGFDLNSPIGADIWKYWQHLYDLGTFPGAHYNVPGLPIEPFGLKTRGHVSSDPTVEGHRHDETALSFALWELGRRAASRGFLCSEGSGGLIARTEALISQVETMRCPDCGATFTITEAIWSHVCR